MIKITGKLGDGVINWWDRYQRTGIKVAFSSKYALVSAVYTKAHFVYLQEEGGIKLPYKIQKG